MSLISSALTRFGTWAEEPEWEFGGNRGRLRPNGGYLSGGPSMRYVGVDLAKRSFTACFLGEDDATELATYLMTPEGLAAFRSQLQPDDRLAVEVGTNAEQSHDHAGPEQPPDRRSDRAVDRPQHTSHQCRAAVTCNGTTRPALPTIGRSWALTTVHPNRRALEIEASAHRKSYLEQLGSNDHRSSRSTISKSSFFR